MSLVTSIQTIVTTLYPDATFKFMSDFHANIEGNKLASSAFPLIVLDNTLRKRVSINPNANTLKRTRLRMLFLTKHSDKSNIHQLDTEMNTLIESMEQIADRVFHNIYQLDDVRHGQNQISEYELIPRFKIFAPIVSGIEAIADWSENTIVRWCTEPEEEE